MDTGVLSVPVLREMRPPGCPSGPNQRITGCTSEGICILTWMEKPYVTRSSTEMPV